MMNAIQKSVVCLQLVAMIATGFTTVLAVPDNDMNQQDRAYVNPGNWGGRGISLVVEKSSATFELDCAKGTIPSRLRIAKGGRFAATGFLTRSGPGPIQLDSPPKPQPVRFEGRVTGKQMRLSITLTGTGDIMGTYILGRGTVGRLVRCF